MSNSAKRSCLLCLAWLLSSTAVLADPLRGSWTLNPGRSHYGGGAERRVQETLECASRRTQVTCTVRSTRNDGRVVVASFTARYDGKPHPVAGMPDVDRVILSRSGDSVADATFAFQGRPVLGYRVIRSDDQQSLTMVAVDPVSRRVLTSVVVYDRRR